MSRRKKEPNRLADELAELGLKVNGEGLAEIQMLASASTGDFSGQKDEVCSCDPQIAVRLVRRGYAEPYVEDQPAADAG
jgi:hypothetical protein